MKLQSLAAMGCLVIGSYCAAQTSASSSGALTLRVRTYNFAKVPSSILEPALSETSRILASAGIETVWDPCDTDSSEGEGHTTDFAAVSTQPQRSLDNRGFLVVRFVRGFPSKIRPNALGFSLPAASSGVHVTIFYDRAENVSLVVAAPLQKVLGNALAHEIGHVLLRSGEHSETGIMKPIWTRGDYQRIAAQCLEFLPREAQAMRNEVSRRAALSNLSPLSF